MQFIKPTLAHKIYLQDYVKEMAEHQDTCHGCGSIEDYPNYEDWLAHIASYSIKANIPKDSKYVEGSQYILFDEINTIVIGMVNIRHELNAYLTQFGGHIGYSIRPTMRNRGFAKMQLNLALDILKEKGVSKALITCNQDNLASQKTILACGGVLDTPSVEPNGTVILRYWISLEKKVKSTCE